MKKISYLLLITVYCLPPVVLFSQTWGALGTDPVGCTVNALKEWNNKLYAGGCLSINSNAMGVASFDGQKFDSLGNGLQSGGAYAFTQHNNILYVGGYFASGGGVPNSASVAGWNDTVWSSTNNIYNDQINAVASYKGELYVGGSFQQLGGNPNAHKIAKWNGSTWSSVGGAFPLTEQAEVYCMAVYNGELYVGGNIGLPGGPNKFYNLIKWNGAKWDSVGGQFGGGYVTSLCVDTVNNVLYIGGGLTFAGAIPIWSVAKWDGINLSSPGGLGITNGALSMCMFNNELYVGGTGWSDTVLAKYDGVTWTRITPFPIYKGSSGVIYALAEYQGNLYVGGDFDHIGTLSANYIACYGNNCPQGVGVQEVKNESLKFKVYPNPAKSELNIEVSGKEAEEKYIVRIKNNLGQEILKKDFSKRLRIDTSQFPKGICLVEVCTQKGEVCHTEKVLLE